jgi:hypothetical protein
MEQGETILNTSLVEISNRLEYYEQQVLGIEKKQDEEKRDILIKREELQVVDYKEYISDVTTLRKCYNCLFNILKYNYRNKKLNYSCLFTFFPLVISFLLLKGTNFGEKDNGYLYLINNLYSVSSSITGTMIIYLFESEKYINFIKTYSFIKILNDKTFYFLYSLITYFITFLFLILQVTCFSYLDENNTIMFKYMLYVLSYAKFLEVIFFYSLMYIFENINIANTLWGIYSVIQYLNSGLSTKHYPELKNYSLYYHLLNILSVKAQEVYNYPLLPNGEPIYTLYGYSKDISNSYYYVFGFFIIPFLIYTCYNKKTKMFLT